MGSCLYGQVDTTNILFICGGAFINLDQQIADRTGAASIGFGNPVRWAHVWDYSTVVLQPICDSFCWACWSQLTAYTRIKGLDLTSCL